MPLTITQTSEGATSWAATQQANLAAIVTFVDALETDLNGFPNELKNLTTAEISQLENIGAVTIAAAQWAYLGDLDQALHTAASVEFADLTLSAPSDFWSMTDGRYFTQAEVLALIAGNLFDFSLSDTADGVIGGYNKMFDADTGEVKSTIGPVTINADPTLIQSFITEIPFPTFTTLSEGVFQLNVHASSTVAANIKDAHLYWTLYRRTQPGGVETLLITSETTLALTAGELHYEIHGVLPAEVTLDASDRLVIKVYGTPVGGEPADPDVSLFLEGDTSSRIAVRTTLVAFDQRYLLIAGGNAMLDDLDMGTKALTNVGNVDGVDVSALKTDVDGFPNELKNLTTAEIQQLENIGATTISAAQWAALGSDAALLRNGTLAMTAELDAGGFNIFNLPSVSFYNPTVTCAGGGGYNLAADDSFAFFRLGPLVFIQGQINIASEDGVPVGNLHVSIPVAGATLDQKSDRTFGFASLTSHGGAIPPTQSARVDAGNSYFQIRTLDAAGAQTFITAADVDTSFAIGVMLVYAAAPLT